MERASKSSRKVPNSERNVDRLSALPDGVICHILSFLRTKPSVQTSVLAKRWRFLWAHVPVLFFEFDYANPKRASFPGIINTVMLRHKVQSLNTFRLTYHMNAANDDDPFGCYEHETCIATVVERNVQNLYLELKVEVPRCLLTCKTLVDLTMRMAVSIPPSAPIFLPNLKELRLWELKCEVDFTRLLSGCPALEELNIQGTKCRDPKGCFISSPTLKRLIIFYLLDSSMFDNPDYLVTINTPALTCLRVEDRSSKHMSVSLFTSLVEADICFNFLYEPDDFNRRCVLKFLDSIRNVKHLRLSGFYDKIFDMPMRGSIAKFDNLTELTLCANWSILTKFLESADHLQVLTILEVSKHWKDPVEKQCACLLHSLRTVRVDFFRCTEQGSSMVRYILRNAQVLERMEIYCSPLDVGKSMTRSENFSIS